MLDINVLKENVEDVKKYKLREQEYEKLGMFNEDVDDVSPDSYFPVDENFEFIKKGFKNYIKQNVLI